MWKTGVGRDLGGEDDDELTGERAVAEDFRLLDAYLAGIVRVVCSVTLCSAFRTR
jgi:hypothetical protein